MSTIISRTLSFVRDASLAWLFGGTPLADAFSLAMRIPTVWRRLLAEGSLSLALTSLCMRYPENHPYMKKTFITLLASVIILMCLGLIFSPDIIYILAPYASPDTLAKATEIFLITLPYIIFATLAAWRMARLHAYGLYLLPACAPILYSAILTGTALIAIIMDAPMPAMIMAGAVLFGGASQWLIQYTPRSILIHKTQIPKKVHDNDHMNTAPHVPFSELQSKLQEMPQNMPQGKPQTRYICLGILTAAIPQLAFCFATALISGFGSGHIAALYYAERLIEFPLGLLAVTTGMLSTPFLIRLCANTIQNTVEHRAQAIERIVLLTLILNIPAAFGLIAIAKPCIRVLFEHGAFDAQMTEITSLCLIAYSLAIPAYALSRPFIALYTGIQATRPLMIASLVSLVAIILLGFALTKVFGAVGAPLGVSLGLWIYTFMLWEGIRKHFVFRFPIIPILYIMLSSTFTLLIAKLMLHLTSSWPEWLSLIAAIIAGVCAYATILFSKEIRNQYLELYRKRFFCKGDDS